MRVHRVIGWTTPHSSGAISGARKVFPVPNTHSALRQHRCCGSDSLGSANPTADPPDPTSRGHDDGTVPQKYIVEIAAEFALSRCSPTAVATLGDSYSPAERVP